MPVTSTTNQPEASDVIRQDGRRQRSDDVEQRCALLEDFARHHGAVNFRRAVVNPVDARVSIQPLDGQILAVPHPAKDLDRAIGDASKRLRRVDLDLS